MKSSPKSWIVLGIFLNVFLAITKWFIGYFGNSFALIADAIESTSDIFASSLVFLGLLYATKPPDEDHPYGHGKAESLVTFIIVGFLVLSSGVIFYQSIKNILTPHELPEAYTLYVLIIIILSKEIYFRWMMKKNKHSESHAIRAEAWHHRSDAISSLTAFVGIALALILGEGYENLDDWAAMVAGGVILLNAYHIFIPAFGEMMDKQTHEHLVDEIRKVAESTADVSGTEKCLIRKHGSHYWVDLHLLLNKDFTVEKAHEIAHAVKENIQNQLPNIGDVLIHVEPFYKD